MVPESRGPNIEVEVEPYWSFASTPFSLSNAPSTFRLFGSP